MVVRHGNMLLKGTVENIVNAVGIINQSNQRQPPFQELEIYLTSLKESHYSA